MFRFPQNAKRVHRCTLFFVFQTPRRTGGKIPHRISRRDAMHCVSTTKTVTTTVFPDAILAVCQMCTAATKKIFTFFRCAARAVSENKLFLQFIKSDSTFTNQKLVGTMGNAMRRNIVNPFICNGYEGPLYFCDREKETEEMCSTLKNRRNITLVSPRRMGKTGLII